jgi:hypothetical protein
MPNPDLWEDCEQGAPRPVISSDSPGHPGQQLDKHLHGHTKGNEKDFKDSGRPGSRVSVPRGTKVP